jgi:hypothetical protein
MSGTGLFPIREGKGGPRKGFIPANRRSDPRQMDRLADALAEGATIRGAAVQIGIGERTATRLFAEMRRRLGWQAV